MSGLQTSAGTSATITLTGSAIVVASVTAGSSTLTVSSITSGTLSVGQNISGSNILNGTSILAQLTGTDGSTGTYKLSAIPTSSGTGIVVNATSSCQVVATWTTASTDLAVESVTSGFVAKGQIISGTGTTTGISITSVDSGGFALGTYTISASQAASGFGIEITANTGTCTVRDGVQPSGYLYPEYEYCSRRGICDFNTGNCACYEGFNNTACDTYKYGIRGLSSSLAYDVMNVQTVDPIFKSEYFNPHNSKYRE